MKKDLALEEWEYLIHHIEITDGSKEEVHHCRILDHIANMFVIKHLVVGKKVYHIIEGLEPTQEVVWSDTDAKDNNIKPKKMKDGMTLKQKAKIW